MELILERLELPLADFELSVSARFTGPVTGIFGPSGAGKTTILDLVAGLRRPRSGRIQWGDRILTEVAARIQVPARLRRMGYVPQDLALFPHLSVERNLSYGHRVRTPPTSLFGFDHVVDVLEIRPLVPRSVEELSGGERQRVALGRALLASPELLLLDEPLANLDRNLKARIIPYLQRVRDEFRLPIIYVSHDAEEIAALCQEVWVLDRGRMVHHGPPGEILGIP